MGRREFLRRAMAASAAGLAPWGAMAGPFETSDFEKLIPADKKLSEDWVRGLFDRGVPSVYRGADLDKIGMPIGGLFAGMLYLGGDGKLWQWDIFNRIHDAGSSGPNYANPLSPASPFEQGFAISTRVHDQATEMRNLDRRGFSDVAFRGAYPVGFVEYLDEAAPVSVKLEAFSPFVPLNVDDSSLPVVIHRYSVHNHSNDTVEVEIAGWIENAVQLYTAPQYDGLRASTAIHAPRLRGVECSAARVSAADAPAPREPIVIARFDEGSYGQWTVEGDAFGTAPSAGQQGLEQSISGFRGAGLVNTYQRSDAPQGRLISPEFLIERRFIRFLIGGGNHPGETCINLIVDGAVVRTETGNNTDVLRPVSWLVQPFEGRSARIEIVDRNSGGWGHVDIDEIEQSDIPATAVGAFEEQHDHGTLSLALLGAHRSGRTFLDLPVDASLETIFAAPAAANGATARHPLSDRFLSGVALHRRLRPGQTAQFNFVVAWSFPNLRLEKGLHGRHYAVRFPQARDAAQYVARHFQRLSEETRRWHDTWYDSSLPYWFLDRTMANTSTLATSTTYRLANGRFYGWEGVGCCAGTCTHVWQYAHAPARLFPEFERYLREHVDFNPEIAFKPDTGVIDHRGEFNVGVAIDGQAGSILRTYREHQMSADGAFLERVWPSAKKALKMLIAQDANGDGILEGPQHNTLDAAWFGQVAWLSSLYLAALRAGEEMARELGDDAFADEARAIFERGQKNIGERLWNGEYFIQVPDPANLAAVGSFNGCEIDQVFGQSWAHQCGLGRILDAEKTRSALRALWRYNFTPDVGPYRAAHTSGRWYAMPGEGGLLMCTHPNGPGKEFKDHPSAWSAMYFNECMSGFEYQVAGHMLAEGLVMEGLAVTRMIHDRYHPSRRNPWNEIECSDHYARAMASYGVFLRATGFNCHGPKGHLAFAPALAPENFRAPFTAAEGWGTYAQSYGPKRPFEATVALKYGRQTLNELTLELPSGAAALDIQIHHDGRLLHMKSTQQGNAITLQLARPCLMKAPSTLHVTISQDTTIERKNRGKPGTDH